MVLREDQAKVKALLTEAITVLCKNGLSYRTEFSVEGLLGITLDNEEVFLININETIRSEFAVALPSTPSRVPDMPSPMSAPPKAGRGRGAFHAGRGRGTAPQAMKPRKRSLEPDFKPNSSPHAASPHSSLGSPPGTPSGAPGIDDQPPAKRPHEDDDDDVIISEEDPNKPADIKQEAASNWDASLEQQAQDPTAMAVSPKIN